MKIKLKNYKQHSSSEYQFPETGLVMIKGPSGAGKSTIMSAIEDSLYGTGKKVKSWYGGKPETELEFANMDIRRTRTPNTLKVGELEDGAAQDKIEENLGMSHKEFMACSYIMQNFKNSILDMTPKDMLGFIENLSSKHENPEEFKKKIKAQVQERKSQLDKATSAYEGVQAALSAIIPVDEPGKTPEFHKEIFEDLKNKHTELSVEIKMLEQEISSLEKNRETFISCEKELEEAEKLQGEASKAVDLLDVLPEDFKSEIQKLKEKIFKKTEFFNKYEELVALSVDVHGKMPEAKEHKGKLTGFLEEKKTEILKIKEDCISARAKEKMKLDMLLDFQKNALECPSCNTPLKMENNKLVHFDSDTSDPEKEIADCRKEIENIEKITNGADKSLEFINSTLRKSAELKVAMPDPNIAPEFKTREDIAKAVESMNRQIEEYDSKKKARDEAVSNLKKISEKVSYLRGKMGEPVTIEEIDNKTHKLVDLKDHHRSIDASLEEHHLDKLAFESWQKRAAKYEQYCEQKENVESKSITYKKALELAHQKHAGAVRLKECADHAANTAIISKINEINEAAAGYIEKMFKEDGTIIQISNTNTTQKGEEKAQLSVELYHKGQESKGISELSGGEKSRACLAFQLGLSELYNSPILMIDEGFTGLNASLQEECISILKEEAENMLILVIEHNAPEHLFDEVIEI